MKFKTKDIEFEVSHLTQVVLNGVYLVVRDRTKNAPARITGKAPLAGAPTFIYNLMETPRDGKKYLLFKHEGRFKGDGKHLIQEAIGGMTPEQMHDFIIVGMTDPDSDVWFSGNVCNIDNIVNRKEARDRVDMQNGKAHTCNDCGCVHEMIREMIREMIKDSVRKVAEKIAGSNEHGTQR